MGYITSWSVWLQIAGWYYMKLTLRLTVSQSVSLGAEPHLGLMTRYLLLFDSYGLDFVGRLLWREDGSVFYICYSPWPAYSFSGPSPLGLVTIFCPLRFKTSLFVVFYDSQGHGGGIRTRLHTDVLLVWQTLRVYYLRLTVYRTPNSRFQFLVSFTIVCLCTYFLGNVHEPLFRKMGSSMSGSTIPAFRMCLPSRFLAMDAWLRLHYCGFPHVTILLNGSLCNVVILFSVR
jgi:hypothetical protein